MIPLIFTIKCSSLPRIVTMMYGALIVLRRGKALGGTKTVIIPTSMVCTWEQVRVIEPELYGTYNHIIV